MEEIKWFSSLGVGGILAGVMFWVYRQDRKDSETRMFQVIDKLMTVVQQNTQILSTLVTLVEEKQQ